MAESSMANSSISSPRYPQTDPGKGPASTLEDLLDRLRRKQSDNKYLTAEFTEALIRQMANAKRKALTTIGE